MSENTNIKIEDTQYRGIRHYYNNDWKIEAYNIERRAIKNKEYNELGITGHSIYFLYGEDENDKIRVYVGRSSDTEDNVPIFTRLDQHNKSKTESYKDIWYGAIAIKFDKLSFDEMRNLENYFFKNIKDEIKLNSVEPDSNKYKVNNIQVKVDYIKEYVTYILKENIFKEIKTKENKIKLTAKLRYSDREINNQGKRLVDKEFEEVTEIQTAYDTINKALDMFPDTVWNPNTVFIDLCCKSGEFLKEIMNRLLNSDLYNGTVYEDISERTLHIINNQLVGVALSDESYKSSVENLRGCKNIIRADLQVIKLFHSLSTTETIIKENKSDTEVKKAQKKQDKSIKELEKLGVKEKSLKEFLNNKLGGRNVNFDVVTGNPPYNKDLYITFASEGHKLASKYDCWITPAKWCGKAGSENNKFRQEVVPNISKINYFPNATELFDIAEIDGISIFFADKEIHKEKEIINSCKINTVLNSKETREINGVLNNATMGIIKKLSGCKNIIVDYSSNHYKIKEDVDNNGDISIFAGGKIAGKCSLNDIGKNRDDIGKYKVVSNEMLGYSFFFDKNGKMIGSPEYNILQPNVVCDTHYCVYRTFDNISEAESLVSYLNTKLIRFITSMSLTGTTTSKEEFWRFVPDPGELNHIFTDEELYKKYSLTPGEINIIESIIKDRK